MRIAFLPMGVLAAGLLVGCVASAQENVAPAIEEDVVEAPAVPVAVPSTPTPPPPPPPSKPIGPATFIFDGELEQGGWINGQVPAGTISAMLDDQTIAFDETGRFFAGFNRDAGATARLVATLANGDGIASTLNIKPRAWNIEHVNVARRAGGASASFMKRRQPELDQIWNARTAESVSNGWAQRFIWPVTGRISGRFGSQRVYKGEPGSYHSGLDIATGESGTPFVAPADGVVTLATSSPFSLEGNLLIIDHGQGLNSAFLHMSKIEVAQGERVTRGQLIGRIGSSGRATGPHLHWSIKWHLARLDPLLFVGPMGD